MFRQPAMDYGYFSIEKKSMDEKPRVFLAEVLQVRCKPLDECEIWSVLSQAVEIVQNLFLKESSNLRKLVVTPSSLAFTNTGKVQFVPNSRENANLQKFTAPEFNSVDETDENCLEKIFIYSLGQTLKYAANYPNENSINLSTLLNSTLNSMCHEDFALRNDVLSILNIIAQNSHSLTDDKPFTHFIGRLYREVLGFSICQDATKDYNFFFSQRVQRSESSSTSRSENDKYGRRLGYCPRKTDLALITSDSNKQMCNDLMLSESLSQDRKRLVEILQLDVTVPETILTNERLRSKSLADVSRGVEVDEVSKMRNINSMHNIPSQIQSQCDTKQKSKMILARPTFRSVVYDADNYPKLIRRRKSSVTKSPKTTIGPEFVVMSSKPNLPLKLNIKHKETSGNTHIKHLKQIIIVLLNGQRLETNCDLTVTKVQHLWDSIVSHEKFNRKFLYGLAYIKDGEFIFLESDQKIQKLVSTGWTEWRGHNQMDVTSFTIYVRVKFYVSHNLIRDKMSRHLQYLQLRRDILEERIRCDAQKAILLASLALQAEFGDYDVNVFGKDYFFLDHYLSPSTVKYLGKENAKRQLIALHGSRKGVTEDMAEHEFIDEMEKLSEFGFHFHTIQEGKKAKCSKTVCLGISLKGIGLFDTSERRVRVRFFEWKIIERITYDEKHLYLTILNEKLSQKKEKLKFHTNKAKNRYLFHIATAHHRLHLLLDCNVRIPDLSFQDAVEQKFDANEEFANEISYELKRDLDQLQDFKTAFEFEPFENDSQSAFVLGTSFGCPKNFSDIYSEAINDSLASRFENLGNASLNERRLVATTLHRSSMHGFGLSVTMGDDQGIYVQSVLPQSPADLTRVLQRGDRIFSVNQILVDCMEYEQVLDLIRECKDKIDIVVSQQIPVHELSTINEELDVSPTKTSFNEPENSIFQFEEKANDSISTEIGENSNSSPHLHEENDQNVSCFDTVKCNGECEIIKYQKFVEQLQSNKTAANSNSNSVVAEAEETNGDIYHVVLEKNEGSFGINIKGGVNSSGTEKNILVQQVIPGGAADLDGRINVGDVILEVNGSNLTNATHQEAVESLRSTASPLAHLTLRRGSPSTLIRVRSASNNNNPSTPIAALRTSQPSTSSSPIFTSPEVLKNAPIERHSSLRSEPGSNYGPMPAANQQFKTTIQLKATANANTGIRRNSSDNWGTKISFGNESANVIRLRVNFGKDPPTPGALRRSMSNADLFNVRRRSSLEWVPSTDSTVKVMTTQGVGNHVFTHNYKKSAPNGCEDGRTKLATHEEEVANVNKSVNGAEKSAVGYKTRALTDPLPSISNDCVNASGNSEAKSRNDENRNGINSATGEEWVNDEQEEVPVQIEYPFINDENTFDLTIVKNSRGLGLSVCGGWDADPKDSIARLIRIKRLYPLQPAVLSGKLQIGDVVLAVNQQSLLGLMYFEAIEILRMASNPIVLTICRPEQGVIPPIPQSTSLLATALCDENDSVPRYNGPSFTEFDITLTKIGGSLGFTLVKLEGPNSGHYIKALVKDPALSDGQLQPGDKIILVNGTDISDMSHSESIKLLRELPDEVTLCVWRQVVPPSSPTSPTSPTAPTFPDTIEKKFKTKPLLRKEALDMLNDKSRPKGYRKNLNSPLASPRIRRKPPANPEMTTDAKDEDAAKDEKNLRVSNRSTSRSTSESSTSGIDKGTSSSDRSYSSPVQIPGAAGGGQSPPESPGKPQRPSYLELNGENVSPRKQKFGRAPHRRDFGSDDLMGDEEESEESSYIRYFDSGDSLLATDDGLTTVTSSEGSPVMVGNSALLKWRGAKLASQEDIGDICEENEDGRNERKSSIITANLHREGNSRLGLSLMSMETNDATGIYVKVVYPGSLADADGRIHVGDKLLQINETDVNGMSVDEAIDLLRNQNSTVSLVLERENDDIKNRAGSSLGRSWSEQENLLSNEVSLLNAKNNNLSSADCLHWNAMASDRNKNENANNS